MSLGSGKMYYGRRKYERRSAFPLGMSPLGRIFRNQAFIGTCTVQDISRGGACLRVHHSDDIPEIFELALDELNLKKACRIVWREKDEVGVEFEPDNAAGP
jgi:PilZ domain